MSTTMNPLVARRDGLSRAALELVNQKEPLSRDDRRALLELRAGMNDLEGEFTDARAAAFEKYLRFGSTPASFTTLYGGQITFHGLTPEERFLLERRDLGVGGSGAAFPGSTSGFFVPANFFDAVQSGMRDVGPMLKLASITTSDTGAPAGYLQDNDSVNTGFIQPENQQSIEVDISNVTQTILKPFKFSSGICKVSIELLLDTGFDLQAYLTQKFSARLGRIINTKTTLGVGVTEPYGFVGQSSVGWVAAGSLTNDGVGLSNTIGSDDIAGLIQSVNVAYHPGASFMCHPFTLNALQRVKNSTGQPVFPGLTNSPDRVNTLFNFPLYTNPNMGVLPLGPSSPPATVVSMAFGNFKRYQIRQVAPMVLRLTDRWIDYGIVAYVMYLRADGNVVDTGGPIKLLTNTY